MEVGDLRVENNVGVTERPAKEELRINAIHIGM